MQLEGVPSVNTSFPTSHAMVTQISKFGVVEENMASSLGVRPVITSLDCEETMIIIKWELTNDEYGIDPEIVKSIRIEWVEVNEDDLMDDLQKSISGMFMPNGAVSNNPMSPTIPFQNHAMPGSADTLGTPGSAVMSPPTNALSRAISAPPTPLQHAKAYSGSMTPQFNGDWGTDLKDMNMLNLSGTGGLIPETTTDSAIYENPTDSVQLNQRVQSVPPIESLSTRRKARSMTLDRWMSKQLDFSLYGDTTNEHAVNARK